MAEFDNLVLSHRDRSRVISEQNRALLFSVPNVFPGTVLVGGFAAGSWRLARSAGAATLTVRLFEPVAGADRDAVAAEGERLLDFAAPGASHEVRMG